MASFVGETSEGQSDPNKKEKSEPKFQVTRGSSERGSPGLVF